MPKQTEPLSEAEILKVVREAVASVSGQDLKEVSPDADLFGLGILKSITLVELVVELDKQFNFSMSVDDFEQVNFESLRSIAQIVRRQAVPARPENGK